MKLRMHASATALTRVFDSSGGTEDVLDEDTGETIREYRLGDECLGEHLRQARRLATRADCRQTHSLSARSSPVVE